MSEIDFENSPVVECDLCDWSFRVRRGVYQDWRVEAAHKQLSLHRHGKHPVEWEKYHKQEPEPADVHNHYYASDIPDWWWRKIR